MISNVLLLTAALPYIAVSYASTLAAKSCSCGYQLKSYDNAYFPFADIQDFSHTPSGPANSSNLPNFYIATGYQTGGGAPDGTSAICEASNVRFKNGALELVVPGGQVANGPLSITGAEIDFLPIVTGGVFTMNAKISGVAGTDQSLFTYHDAAADGDIVAEDEQDIEIISATLFNASTINGTPAGIELTNWDPSDPNDSTRQGTIVPFPKNPTTAFHNYTIFWPNNGTKHTKYYFDGKHLEGPTLYSSVNPSVVILNHWSNGDPQFTQGPPKTDAIMKIKGVQFYYKTAAQYTLPSGCKWSQVCAV